MENNQLDTMVMYYMNLRSKKARVLKDTVKELYPQYDLEHAMMRAYLDKVITKEEYNTIKEFY